MRVILKWQIIELIFSEKMQTHKSGIVQNSDFLPGIQGLRGLAALTVVLYHLIHIVGIAPPDAFKFMGRDFGYSVHLFFILSAFSLCYTTDSKINNPLWLSEYFMKRLFRIAPLFYLVIIFELARQFLSGGVSVDLYSILLELTFTFGLVPFSDFIWGGWSVGAEMVFYAIFPVLILAVRSKKSAFILLVISIFICSAIRTKLHIQHINAVPLAQFNWSYFSPLSNLCFFIMGIYAYYLRGTNRESFFIRKIIPWFTVLLIGILLAGIGKYLYGPARLEIVLWGLAFTGLCVWQSITPIRVISNSFLRFLGDRSFSIYLLHPIIIFFSKDFLVNTHAFLQLKIGDTTFFILSIILMVMVLMLSELTYRFIEVPGIRFGGKLIGRRRASFARSDHVQGQTPTPLIST